MELSPGVPVLGESSRRERVNKDQAEVRATNQALDGKDINVTSEGTLSATQCAPAQSDFVFFYLCMCVCTCV